MEERSPGNISHGTSDLLSCMDDINTKGINGVSSNVISVDSGDQDLSLVVVNEEASNHGGKLPKNEKE